MLLFWKYFNVIHCYKDGLKNLISIQKYLTTWTTNRFIDRFKLLWGGATLSPVTKGVLHEVFKVTLCSCKAYYKESATKHCGTHGETPPATPSLFFLNSTAAETAGTSAQHSKTLTSVPPYNLSCLFPVLWMAAPLYSHQMTMKWVWCAICCVQMLKEETKALTVLVQAHRLLPERSEIFSLGHCID